MGKYTKGTNLVKFELQGEKSYPQYEKGKCPKFKLYTKLCTLSTWTDSK